MSVQKSVIFMMFAIYSLIALNLAFMYGFNTFFADKFNFRMTFFYSFIASFLNNIFNSHNFFVTKDFSDNKEFVNLCCFMFFKPIIAFFFIHILSLFL